jgi:putative restriction endonuclease
LEQHDWIPVPESFKKNIVTGKSYESETDECRQLIEMLRLRLAGPSVLARDSDLDEQSGYGDQDRYGNPLMVRPRLGQGSFRVLVTEIYQRRCALTGEKTLPVLEAAHIKPYAELAARGESPNGHQTRLGASGAWLMT